MTTNSKINLSHLIFALIFLGSSILLNVGDTQFFSSHTCRQEIEQVGFLDPSSSSALLRMPLNPPFQHRNGVGNGVASFSVIGQNRHQQHSVSDDIGSIARVHFKQWVYLPQPLIISFLQKQNGWHQSSDEEPFLRI